MGRPIRISSVVMASICPVLFSLEQGHACPPSPAPVICRQLASHLGSPLDSSEIWDEVSVAIPKINPIWRTYLEGCVAACEGNTWRPPLATDVPVRSEKFHLYGNVDRLFDTDPRFAVVRAARPPPAGIYKSDRIRLAGYALCLREMALQDPEVGSVEYIPFGVSRKYHIQQRDFRAFFHAMDAVKRVMEGTVPRKPPFAPCERCAHRETCGENGVRRLSELL